MKLTGKNFASGLVVCLSHCPWLPQQGAQLVVAGWEIN